MPEVREVHLLEAVPYYQLVREFPPCSPSLTGHDWAKLMFAEMVVGVRCQKCGREPLDIMSAWRIDEPDAN